MSGLKFGRLGRLLWVWFLKLEQFLHILVDTLIGFSSFVAHIQNIDDLFNLFHV